MSVLSLECIAQHEPSMRARGVSKVARSPRGFLTAYRRAGGDLDALPAAWQRRRVGFIARHEAQRHKRHEPLYDAAGSPTRRHLALIAWAYSPAQGCPRVVG